jgi:hypothetical protein
MRSLPRFEDRSWGGKQVQNPQVLQVWKSPDKAGSIPAILVLEQRSGGKKRSTAKQFIWEPVLSGAFKSLSPDWLFA